MGSWDRGVMAHDNHMIVAVDRSSPNRTVHDFCGIFSYKTVFSPFVNSGRELRNFLARSIVLHDPPAFRIDCDPIGAGLITNRCLIRSYSPLERQTNARKRPSQILFHPRELKSNSRVNRVSTENQSFILQPFVFRLDLGG